MYEELGDGSYMQWWRITWASVYRRNDYIELLGEELLSSETMKSWKENSLTVLDFLCCVRILLIKRGRSVGKNFSNRMCVLENFYWSVGISDRK